MGDGHMNILIGGRKVRNPVAKLLEQKPALAGNKPKDPEVVMKHFARLSGKGYGGCAVCPGTSGKVEEDGKMKCSRAGAKPVPVTTVQTDGCDGSSPLSHRVPEERKHTHFRLLHLAA